MTTISETDLHVFAQLANPQKAHINNLQSLDDEHTTPALDERSEEDDDSEDEKPRDSSDDENSEDESRNPNRAPPSEIRSEAARSYVARSEAARSEAARSDVARSDVARSDVKSHVRSDAGRSETQNDDNRSVVSSASDRESVRSNQSDRSNRSNANASHVSRKSFASQINNEPTIESKRRMSLPILNSVNSEDSEVLEKQQVLMDMERLKLQGIKLSKEWTLRDRLDDMQFEVRRHMLHIDEMNNINMMRDGMRLMCSGFEMANTQFGFLELEGWASEVTSDMDKYDNALGRIYRKYWRRGTQNSPEMEIALGLIGSVGMYHFKSKLQKNMFQKSVPPSFGNSFARPKPPAQTRPLTPSSADSSSDEDAPP
jgi:hypothetical protein